MSGNRYMVHTVAVYLDHIMPIVEFVWWSGTDAFLADYHQLFRSTIDHVSNADGCLRIFCGLQEQDKTSFWMVVVWKSHAHHKAMMDRPDYSEMVGDLKPFFRDGQLKMIHAEFDNDTDPAFNSPVTEVLILSLKGTRTFENTKDRLQKYLEGVAKIEGVHSPVAWGVTNEDSRKATILVGWGNMKKYQDSLEDRKRLDSELSQVANLEDLHIHLQQFATSG